MRTCESIVKKYIDSLSSGFSCEDSESFLILTTPYQYSDGDYINIFVEEIEGVLKFSDFGETIRKLTNVNFNYKTRQFRSLFSTILATNNISSDNGDLFFQSDLDEDFGDRFGHLLQAIQQTENILFTQKEKGDIDFRSEVEKFLISENFSPILNMQIKGDSGTIWQINFFINHKSNIMIKALSSPVKSREKDMISKVHTAYQDIHIIHPGFLRSIILDDKAGAWEEENVNLAKQVLDLPVGYWSIKERFSSDLKTHLAV